MKVYHASLKVKILNLIISLAMLLLMGVAANLCIQTLDIFTRILEGSRLAFVILLILLFFILATIKFTVYFVSVLKVQLIFDDQSLTIKSVTVPNLLLWRRLKPFSIEYERVRSIFFNFVGILEIIDIRGKRYAFPLELFEEEVRGDILLELKNRMPPRALSSILERSAFPQYIDNLIAVRNWVLPVILLLLLLVYYLEPPNSQLIQVWKPEMRLSWYEIYHSSDVSMKRWQWGLEPFENQPTEYISGDADGEPVIWLKNGIMRYTTNKWEFVPYKENLELEPSSKLEAISNGYVVALSGKGGRLLTMNASNGDWYELMLPVGARQNGLMPESIKRTVDGELLVLMKNNRESRVYLLSRGEWSPHEYAIIEADGLIRDYFLDQEDMLWVLLSIRGQFIVERLNKEGNVSVTKIPISNKKEDATRYYSLHVDTFGRLWIEGSSPIFIAVFDPVWDGAADELIRYTITNSNYQVNISSPAVLLPDGKLLSFGRQVVSMNTSMKDFQDPLSDWYASLNWDVIRMGLLTIFYLLIIIPPVSQKIYRLALPGKK